MGLVRTTVVVTIAKVNQTMPSVFLKAIHLIDRAKKR